uniref:Uncharacterized protein n=1 Tax=Arundo donax TaxID=35708 RepID=A0A0A9H077_ARUDO
MAEGRACYGAWNDKSYILKWKLLNRNRHFKLYCILDWK